MTGLQYSDLAAWQAWSASRSRVSSRLRAAKARMRPVAAPSATMYVPAGVPRTLVVLDLLTPSCRFAAHDPLRHLDAETTAVLTSLPDPELPTSGSWTATPWHGSLDRSIEQVLSLGSYFGLSAQVKALTRGSDVRFNVVQHGLLTPWSPPSAEGDHLLAWTQEDADYWRSSTPGVTLRWSAPRCSGTRRSDRRPRSATNGPWCSGSCTVSNSAKAMRCAPICGSVAGGMSRTVRIPARPTPCRAPHTS